MDLRNFHAVCWRVYRFCWRLLRSSLWGFKLRTRRNSFFIHLRLSTPLQQCMSRTTPFSTKLYAANLPHIRPVPLTSLDIYQDLRCALNATLLIAIYRRPMRVFRGLSRGRRWLSNLDRHLGYDGSYTSLCHWQNRISIAPNYNVLQGYPLFLRAPLQEHSCPLWTRIWTAYDYQLAFQVWVVSLRGWTSKWYLGESITSQFRLHRTLSPLSGPFPEVIA